MVDWLIMVVLKAALAISMWWNPYPPPMSYPFSCPAGTAVMFVPHSDTGVIHEPGGRIIVFRGERIW